ncbi:MAG: DNA mismatch repair protein MutS, partial [Oscillospiraceae bacterium]|nr:DNA mismatch repair protein MutS [Oscillospiraceae bacterium]
MDKTGLTPMMAQYMKIKEQHKDHLVFFRLGDFYEMFFDDAIIGSKELELTLTGRDCGLEERAPMCGVPHHSSEAYISRLIRKGYKVAVCEQMENPALAKGVVSREVVRVITPGTLMENNLLVEDTNNFLCCVFLDSGAFGEAFGEAFGLVFADISTGEMNLIDLEKGGDDAVISELARYMPREVIFNTAFVSKTDIARFMRDKLACTADLVDDIDFDYETAKKRVEAHFNKTIEDLGLDKSRRVVCAAGALLGYLYETQKVGVERLIGVNVIEENRYMALDTSAR